MRGGLLAIMLFAGLAGVAGYAALVSAARGIVTRRVVTGLLLGIVANVYGIWLVRDINSGAMRDWTTWYWLGSPILVALAHVMAYIVMGRRSSVHLP